MTVPLRSAPSGDEQAPGAVIASRASVPDGVRLADRVTLMPNETAK